MKSTRRASELTERDGLLVQGHDRRQTWVHIEDPGALRATLARSGRDASSRPDGPRDPPRCRPGLGILDLASGEARPPGSGSWRRSNNLSATPNRSSRSLLVRVARLSRPSEIRRGQRPPPLNPRSGPSRRYPSGLIQILHRRCDTNRTSLQLRSSRPRAAPWSEPRSRNSPRSVPRDRHSSPGWANGSGRNCAATSGRPSSAGVGRTRLASSSSSSGSACSSATRSPTSALREGSPSESPSPWQCWPAGLSWSGAPAM